jgi:hypothetical protein
MRQRRRPAVRRWPMRPGMPVTVVLPVVARVAARPVAVKVAAHPAVADTVTGRPRVRSRTMPRSHRAWSRPRRQLRLSMVRALLPQPLLRRSAAARLRRRLPHRLRPSVVVKPAVRWSRWTVEPAVVLVPVGGGAAGGAQAAGAGGAGGGAGGCRRWSRWCWRRRRMVLVAVPVVAGVVWVLGRWHRWWRGRWRRCSGRGCGRSGGFFAAECSGGARRSRPAG